MFRTNCAFVNYKTKEACLDAIGRFSDRAFYGQRLVCRMRLTSPRQHDVSNANNSAKTASLEDIPPLESDRSSSQSSQPSSEPDLAVTEGTTPLIVDGDGLPKSMTGTVKESLEETLQEDYAKSEHVTPSAKVRFFVLKSLTVQDLQVSTRDGAWTTQPHNEDILNEAYTSAEDVYLIFSANKSGTYFGYARMDGPIPRNKRSVSDASEAASTRTGTHAPAGGARVTMTPATATAPRGYIIDDSLRGNIFWEAGDGVRDTNEPGDKSPTCSGADDWSARTGKAFPVQWISTTQVPFHVTRGLRNRLNCNREVKIARDGQEVRPQLLGPQPCFTSVL